MGILLKWQKHGKFSADFDSYSTTDTEDFKRYINPHNVLRNRLKNMYFSHYKTMKYNENALLKHGRDLG